MTDGEWTYQMLLLIYLVVFLSLRDCSCNRAGTITGDRPTAVPLQQLKVYRQVPALFKELHDLGHKLAVISQTADNATLCQLLDFFDLDKFITYREIYPGNKTEHVEAVYLKAEIDYGDMMYLAKEFKEIAVMADHGMVCILVGDQGVTMDDIRKGIHIFSTDSPEYSYSEDTHESSYLLKE